MYSRVIILILISILFGDDVSGQSCTYDTISCLGNDWLQNGYPLYWYYPKLSKVNAPIVIGTTNNAKVEKSCLNAVWSPPTDTNALGTLQYYAQLHGKNRTVFNFVGGVAAGNPPIPNTMWTVTFKLANGTLTPGTIVVSLTDSATYLVSNNYIPNQPRFWQFQTINPYIKEDDWKIAARHLLKIGYSREEVYDHISIDYKNCPNV